MAELFGLKPWEICGGPNELLLGEVAEFQAHLKRVADAAKKRKGT